MIDEQNPLLSNKINDSYIYLILFIFGLLCNLLSLVWIIVIIAHYNQFLSGFMIIPLTITNTITLIILYRNRYSNDNLYKSLTPIEKYIPIVLGALIKLFVLLLLTAKTFLWTGIILIILTICSFVITLIIDKAYPSNN